MPLRFLFAFVLLLPQLLSAENDRSRETLKAFEGKVSYATLSNGIRVIMYHRGIAPTFAGVVAVRVGGTDEMPGNTGISHMFEHMAFKGTSQIGTKNYTREKVLLERLEVLVAQAHGTQNFNAEQQREWNTINEELTKNIWSTENFTREYEKHGASGMNATTDSELTRYFVNLPRTAFEFWCAMESARLTDPVIRQFYQERDVVMEERRMRNDDSPEGKLYESLIDKVFELHPYRFPVIGYPQDVSTLTATAVSNFRKTYYVPNNIVIALVGDINPARDLKTVERYFGDLAVGPKPPRPTEVEPEQTKEREVVVPFKASPMTYMAYRKPVYPDPDDAPISVLAEILAGSKVAPLYTELVKKRQIITGTGSDEGPGYAYPNMLVISLTPRAPHTNAEAIAAYDQVLDHLKQTGVTAEQLAIAKRAMVTQDLAKLKSNMSLAIDLASTELTHGSWKVIFDWYDQVRKVSREDIQRVLNRYFVPSNRTIARLETSSNAGGN